jgi:hypothetical protein
MFVRAGVSQIAGLASASRYAMEKGKVWKGIPCAWVEVELRSYLKVMDSVGFIVWYPANRSWCFIEKNVQDFEY